MDSVKVARIFVISLFVFAIVFVAFGIMQTRKQAQLESELESRGQIVIGRIVAMSESEPSSSSSVEKSFFVDVEYAFDDAKFVNPYTIDRSRYEVLSPGDPIEVTVLPDSPRLSQLTEYVGKPLMARGFIPLDD
ncbi:MAG: DUF3592 domain-containing protein [Myxococcota bacterium]